MRRHSAPFPRHSSWLLLAALLGCQSGADTSTDPAAIATLAFQQEYSPCPDGSYRSHWWTSLTEIYLEELRDPVVTAEAYPLTTGDSLVGVTWRGVSRLTAASRHRYRKSLLPGNDTSIGKWAPVESPAFDLVLPMRQVNGFWAGPDYVGLLHDGESMGAAAGCVDPPE